MPNTQGKKQPTENVAEGLSRQRLWVSYYKSIRRAKGKHVLIINRKDDNDASLNGGCEEGDRTNLKRN